MTPGWPSQGVAPARPFSIPRLCLLCQSFWLIRSGGDRLYTKPRQGDYRVFRSATYVAAKWLSLLEGTGIRTPGPPHEKNLRFFADRAAKKWPLRGSLKLGESACSLPSMTDGLSTLYQDLLGGSYDCVDRIVLNAYFRMGHYPGGFRVRWRALTGSDETLENAGRSFANAA